MCTVVTEWLGEGQPARLLAIRDEFVSREFDDPGEWWPDRPGVVGGRDRLAGGSWCVSDVGTGTTALVLNRTERQRGTPSRGVLPLAAVELGDRWPTRIDVRQMASFTLVLVTATGVSAWTWDATDLTRTDLPPGQHVVTVQGGVDRSDPKTTALAPQFATRAWLDVVTDREPADDRTALVVRHPFETDTYATVFGQLLTVAPGRLGVESSRTPWRRDTWVAREWRG